VSCSLPVDVDADRDEVTLLDIDPATFDPHEPFLVMTVERLGADGATLRRAPTSALADATTDADAPVAFVAHTGRCGSTLLTNLLATRRDVMVFREPDAVTGALEPMVRHRDDEAAATRLDAVVRAYAAVAAACGRRAVVKLSSPTASLAPVLADRFPTVPFVGVWREPAETVASFLAMAAPWAARLYEPAEHQARWWPDLAEREDGPLTAVRFFARCWNSAATGLAALPADRRRLLAYPELTTAATSTPDQLVEAMTRWFGLPAGEQLVERLHSASRIYSKDPTRREAFDPAERHRRPPLPAAAAADVERLTGPARARLAAAGRPL
jgi:hypothetical protein